MYRSIIGLDYVVKMSSTISAKNRHNVHAVCADSRQFIFLFFSLSYLPMRIVIIWLKCEPHSMSGLLCEPILVGTKMLAKIAPENCGGFFSAD